MWWAHFCNRRLVRVNAEISMGNKHIETSGISVNLSINQAIDVSKWENK